jgi:hypothetical protein
MSDLQAAGGDAVLLRIEHDESNSKFAIRCSNPELLTERNGLKRLLRSVVPKLNENANISGDVSAAVLSYRDEEGDQITVRTDSDLKEAIRLAGLRQICVKISFDCGVQSAINLDACAAAVDVGASADASASAVGASWSDSSSDVQIECEHAASDAAAFLLSAATEHCGDSDSTRQNIAVKTSDENAVHEHEHPRILFLEKSMQQCVVYCRRRSARA